MLAYLVLFSIPAIASMHYRYSIARVNWFFLFVLFSFFVGLRHQVGPDWWQYTRWLEIVGTQDFFSLFSQPEPLSKLLFWISYQLNLEIYSVNLAAALIMMLGVFAFARKTVNPWLAVVAATPYFILVIGMSGVRQAAAAGIILYLLAHWDRYSIVRRVGIILFAALFHTSAIIALLLIVTQLRANLFAKILMMGIIGAAALLIGSELDVFAQNIEVYRQRYIDSDIVSESLGAFYHIGFIMIPALLGWRFRRRIYSIVEQKQLLALGLISIPFLLALTAYSTTAASRLTVYLYFVPMLVFPALTQAFGQRNRRTVTALILGYHYMLLFIWFTLSNHRHAYIPYDNVLWPF
jgi:hypothetical protein